jgi:basic membrane lipoprotein Med (substrate-binding protein (PBP1-ABC) superfamily)
VLAFRKVERSQTEGRKAMDGRRFRMTRWVALLAIVSVVLVACGGDDGEGTDASPTGETTGATEGEPFRVAVVTPSAPNDLAFSQSMVDALNSLRDEKNLEIAVSDSLFVVEDAAAAIRDYANDGYDLVIGHGSQFGGSIQEIAPDFPDVSFAWGTAADTFGLPNVYAYEAASDQGGYVMGVMAAALSTSGVIGVVGPIEVGDAKLYVDGFVAGAEAENSSIDVRVTYTGSFSDVALASEAAESFIQAGADVMTGTAQMVVGAVGVAQEQGVPWFGTQADQASLAPDVVVASQVYHWEVVLTEMIDAIQGGALGGQTYAIDLANGGEVIEYNAEFGLSADVQATADETIEGIKSGSITTGVTG